MGYPYSWHKKTSAGITGPSPQSYDNTIKREFDLYGRSDSESFFAGFSALEYKSLIRASIQRIMMTTPGERVMTPEFGCDLRRFLFEHGTTSLEIDIKHEISKSISRWEPRITIQDIDIQQEDEKITFVIPYIINGSNIEDQITYVLNNNKG